MNFEIINTRRNNKIYTNGIDTYKVFNENYDKRLVFLESFIPLYCIEFSHVNAPPIEPSECITVSNLAFSSFLIIAAPAPSPKRIAVVLSVQSTICDKPSAPMTNAVSTKPAFM